ncbi:hypothetical protein Dimus_007792 [Dionaea muscipula]
MVDPRRKRFRLFGVEFVQEYTDTSQTNMPASTINNLCDSCWVSVSSSLGSELAGKPTREEEELVGEDCFCCAFMGVGPGILSEQSQQDLGRCSAAQSHQLVGKPENGDMNKAPSSDSLLSTKKRRRCFGNLSGDEYDDAEPPTKKRRLCATPLMGNNAEPVSVLSIASPVSARWFTLPADFAVKIRSFDGSDVRLVIEKELTASDMNPYAARLSMPRKKTSLSLTEAEGAALESKDENGKHKKLDVKVVDPSLQMRELAFKRWPMGITWSYVLVGAWNRLTKENKLKKGDLMQVWSFRMEGGNGRLGFALVKVREAPTDHCIPLPSWGKTAMRRKIRRPGRWVSAAVNFGKVTDSISACILVLRWGKTAKRRQ